ncbi:hypothetical protein BKA69DRAFT_427420 [Paraphysoderma sedebokerense]|nr:hypothetical protein BKA69DRAFT_427420 [Paraphysoderma sedebokerense]
MINRYPFIPLSPLTYNQIQTAKLFTLSQQKLSVFKAQYATSSTSPSTSTSNSLTTLRRLIETTQMYESKVQKLEKYIKNSQCREFEQWDVQLLAEGMAVIEIELMSAITDLKMDDLVKFVATSMNDQGHIDHNSRDVSIRICLQRLTDYHRYLVHLFMSVLLPGPDVIMDDKKMISTVTKLLQVAFTLLHRTYFNIPDSSFSSGLSSSTKSYQIIPLLSLSALTNALSSPLISIAGIWKSVPTKLTSAMLELSQIFGPSPSSPSTYSARDTSETVTTRFPRYFTFLHTLQTIFSSSTPFSPKQIQSMFPVKSPFPTPPVPIIAQSVIVLPFIHPFLECIEKLVTDYSMNTESDIQVITLSDPGTRKLSILESLLNVDHSVRCLTKLTGDSVSHMGLRITSQDPESDKFKAKGKFGPSLPPISNSGLGHASFPGCLKLYGGLDEKWGKMVHWLLTREWIDRESLMRRCGLNDDDEDDGDGNEDGGRIGWVEEIWEFMEKWVGEVGLRFTAKDEVNRDDIEEKEENERENRTDVKIAKNGPAEGEPPVEPESIEPPPPYSFDTEPPVVEQPSTSNVLQTESSTPTQTTAEKNGDDNASLEQELFGNGGLLEDDVLADVIGAKVS